MVQLSSVVSLAQGKKMVFLATSNGDGEPHVASVNAMQQQDKEHVTLEGWLCPVTSRNIQANPRVAIVVWEEGGSGGFQLTGTVEETEEVAVMDGYAPGVEEGSLPQTDRKLVIRVDAVRAFPPKPHTEESLE